MSVDPKKLLEELSTSFETEFAEVKTFRPRYVKLDEFTPVNDEELDKAGEIEIDETVTLTQIDGNSVKDLSQGGEVKPVSATDTSSARLGDRSIVICYTRVGTLRSGSSR